MTEEIILDRDDVIALLDAVHIACNEGICQNDTFEVACRIAEQFEITNEDTDFMLFVD